MIAFETHLTDRDDRMLPACDQNGSESTLMMDYSSGLRNPQLESIHHTKLVSVASHAVVRNARTSMNRLSWLYYAVNAQRFSRSFPFQLERENRSRQRENSVFRWWHQHSRRESVTYILTLYMCIARHSRSQTLDVAPGTPEWQRACSVRLARSTRQSSHARNWPLLQPISSIWLHTSDVANTHVGHQQH